MYNYITLYTGVEENMRAQSVVDCIISKGKRDRLLNFGFGNGQNTK